MKKFTITKVETYKRIAFEAENKEIVETLLRMGDPFGYMLTDTQYTVEEDGDVREKEEPSS